MSTTQVGVYVRISSDPEGLRAGVERQTEDCEALCAKHGWQVVRIYEDNDVSAYSGRKVRKGYQALCEAVRAGTVDTVVTWHPDRLHRSPRELEDFIDLLDVAGAKVRTVTAGDWDLSTPDGRLTARIVGAVARKESEDKSRRIRRKHQELAKEGRYHGGGRPFGYEYDTDGSGDLVVNEKEADAIRDAVHKVRQGVAGTRSIARDWNALPLPTTKGNMWTAGVVRKCLASPLLAGIHPRTGERAQWSPILTKAEHEAVRSILTAPSRRTNGGLNARKNPLAGLVYCGRCEGLLRTGKTNGKPAMRCDKGKSTKHDGCGRLTVVLDPLMDAVGSLIVERLFLARQTLGLASMANTKRSSEDGNLAAELDALRARMADLEQMFTAGDVTGAQFKRMKADLEERQEACMRQLATTQEAVSLAALPTTREALQAAWDSGDFDTRRTYATLVLERIEVRPADHKGQRFTPDRLEPRFRDLSA